MTNGLVGLLALYAGVRPVSTNSLWWDLSRGREVLRGTMTPSRDLLALDSLPEADWLSGVLPFLLYTTLGATALMIGRIAVAFGLGFVLRRQLRSVAPWVIVSLVGGTLVLCEPAFDPGPLMWDILGICTVYAFATHQTLMNHWRRNVFIGLVMFCLWANLASHPLVGLLVLTSALGMRNANEKLPSGKFWLIVAAAFAGCCLTPRGLLTLWDSLRLTFPRCVVESWVIEGTSWLPLHRSETPLRICLFGVLTSVSLFLVIRRDARLPTICAWGAIQVIAWSASENLPLATVWLAFVITSLLEPSHDRAPSSQSQSAMSLLPLAVAFAVVLVLSGWTKLGWGVDERLDERYLSIALEGLEPKGTAMAENVRGAGMLTWQRASTIPVQDVPQRALLGGRLADHVKLLSDLASERRASYWREDGTQGGWWIPLMQRNTTLLLIDANHFEAIRGLEPTLWKPLSLDSPIVPYGSTADPVYTQDIVEILKQRHVIEVGPWTYTPPQSSGSQYDRDFGWGRETLSSQISIRQARVFRAMRLPRAASKVLLQEQRLRYDKNVVMELALCQEDLAHAEFIHAGQVSAFRELAAQSAAHRTRGAVNEVAKSNDSTIDLSDAVADYLDGHLEAALARLFHNSATQQERYAFACLLIEAGSPEQAADVLATIENEADNGLRVLAIWLRQQLTFDIEDN